ncbi:MAG: hypothetical protein JSS66_15280 [Armatimonadetes bacterium]|nr:hypothetical protein [Armatimonadota bacterium]
MFKIERNLLTLTLAALALAAHAQNDNPFGGTGSINSQHEFKREIRNANDTGVEGTEFFKLNYECTWELVRTLATEDKSKQQCENKCNGRKHIKHTDCDLSCDTPCPVHVHRFSFAGHTQYLDKAMREAEKDADNLVYQTGADPHDANWTSYMTRSLSNAKRLSEQLHRYAVNCWNDQPCSIVWRYYGLRRYDFKVTGKLTETGYYMSRGVKTPFAPRNRGTHTKIVAHVWLPEDDPLASFKGLRCKCEPAKVRDGGIGEPPVRDGWVPGLWEGYLLWDDDDTVINDDHVQLTITGVDMNRVHVEVFNDTDKEITVHLGGGLILNPTDDHYQSMTVTVATDIKVGPHQKQGADVRAACTAMNKLEPTSAVQFKLSQTTNPSLADLSAITNASHFRGPADQARIWILTDHVPFNELQKHLLPSPSAGQYLNALYDVSRATGVDIHDGNFKNCFDPALLTATTAKNEAVAWFVEELDRDNPKAFSDLVKGHIGEIRGNFGDKTEDYVYDSVGELTKDLGSCSSMEGRLAGLAVLLQAIPEKDRDKVVAKGGLDSVIVSTQSEDPKEQSQALDVIDQYCHKPSLDQVERLAALGANEEVRQKAAEVAKRLKA